MKDFSNDISMSLKLANQHTFLKGNDCVLCVQFQFKREIIKDRSDQSHVKHVKVGLILSNLSLKSTG